MLTRSGLANSPPVRSWSDPEIEPVYLVKCYEKVRLGGNFASFCEIGSDSSRGATRQP